MEEKQLNMPDEHPVPKKKRKGKAGRILCFCLFLSLSPAQPLATISTNTASQPKNWINILPASRALISTQWKVCSRKAQSFRYLDNADVRNATYESFFKSINAKMTEDHKDTFQFSRRHCRSHCADPLCRRI